MVEAADPAAGVAGAGWEVRKRQGPAETAYAPTAVIASDTSQGSPVIRRSVRNAGGRWSASRTGGEERTAAGEAGLNSTPPDCRPSMDGSLSMKGAAGF